MVLPIILAGVAVLVAGGTAVAMLSDDESEELKNEADSWHARGKEFQRNRNKRLHAFRSAGKSNYHGSRAMEKLHDGTRLNLVDETSGETFLSMSAIHGPGLINWDDVVWEDAKRPGSVISKLNPLLSAVPNLAIAGNVLTTNYAVVSIPLNQLANSRKAMGELAPVVHDGKNIIEQATLSRPSLLTNLASGAVIWQVASMIVAQRHLHDISKKLDKISMQIEEVSRFQRDKRVSDLQGIVAGFIDFKREIGEHQFEHISVDLIQKDYGDLEKIKFHVAKDLSHSIDDLRGSRKIDDEFVENTKKVSMLFKEIGLCIVGQMYGIQIMAILSEDVNFLEGRLYKTKDYARDLLVVNVELALKTIGISIDECKGSGLCENSITELGELRSSGDLEDIVSFVDEELVATEKILERRKEPASMLLRINGGKIDRFACLQDG